MEDTGPESYLWKGRSFLLMQDLTKRFGPSLWNRWYRSPEKYRLTLSGEDKDFFCEGYGLDHKQGKISLLENSEEAWMFVVGIPRSPEALEICREIKDAAFDYFWLSARQREVREEQQVLLEKRKQTLQKLQETLEGAKKIKRKYS